MSVGLGLDGECNSRRSVRVKVGNTVRVRVKTRVRSAIGRIAVRIRVRVRVSLLTPLPNNSPTAHFGSLASFNSGDG